MSTTLLPPVTTTTAAELRALPADGVHVIDVRTPGEYETAHIPGAHNVPLDLLQGCAADLVALDRPVVLVCQSGARATTASERLAAAGGSGLRLLEGGMGAWTAAGGDVVRGARERWALERQVRLVAGSIVLTSTLASLRWSRARAIAGAVGAGLTFAALSDTCAMGTALSKLPYNRGASCDLDAVIGELTAADATAVREGAQAA